MNIPTTITAKLLNAIKFATEAHGVQSRKARKAIHLPYMVHPIEVSQILFDCVPGHSMGPAQLTELSDTLCAAILHDVLEDTKRTASEIEGRFGKGVLSIVQEVTDDKSKTKEERRALQLEHMLVASRPARLVKVADKISNVRDLVRCPPGWKLSSVRAYCDHATQVVTYATSKQDLPPVLVEEFWQARQNVLDWLAEEEVKETAETPK